MCRPYAVQLRMYQKTPNIPSMRIEPSVIRAPSSGNDMPVNCRNGADSSISCARIVSLPEYQRLRAKKMLQVPSLTMNGGKSSRVTSTALRRPPPMPTTSRQHDERLGDGHEADERDLLEHERDVEGMEKLVPNDDAEKNHAEQQHNGGNCRRIHVQEVLQPLERRVFVFVEGRDFGIALLRYLFVVGHPLRRLLLAIGH